LTAGPEAGKVTVEHSAERRSAMRNKDLRRAEIGKEGLQVLQTPRSTLFVPGDRPERIAKALGSGAEAVVVDLEDAVAESVKDQARQLAVRSLTDGHNAAATVLVRCNAVRTPHFTADVAALRPLLGRLGAVVLPMVEGPSDVQFLDEELRAAEEEAGLAPGATRIVPTVETAAGALDARHIAGASPRVLTLLFGSADLSHQLAVTPTAAGDELAVARSLVVLGAAAAGVAAPIDGPYLVLDDDTGLQTSTRRARDLGFGGKAVIHPAQLPTVTRLFRPTEEELSWAREVNAAFLEAEGQGRSAVRLRDGTFIDYPVAQRARALLGAETGGNTR
jgi:citrate lyase subunit beta/citryl-CoA lyase